MQGQASPQVFQCTERKENAGYPLKIPGTGTLLLVWTRVYVPLTEAVLFAASCIAVRITFTASRNVPPSAFQCFLMHRLAISLVTWFPRTRKWLPSPRERMVQSGPVFSTMAYCPHDTQSRLLLISAPSVSVTSPMRRPSFSKTLHLSSLMEMITPSAEGAFFQLLHGMNLVAVQIGLQYFYAGGIPPEKDLPVVSCHHSSMQPRKRHDKAHDHALLNFPNICSHSGCDTTCLYPCIPAPSHHPFAENMVFQDNRRFSHKSA